MTDKDRLESSTANSNKQGRHCQVGIGRAVMEMDTEFTESSVQATVANLPFLEHDSAERGKAQDSARVARSKPQRSIWESVDRRKISYWWKVRHEGADKTRRMLECIKSTLPSYRTLCTDSRCGLDQSTPPVSTTLVSSRDLPPISITLAGRLCGSGRDVPCTCFSTRAWTYFLPHIEDICKQRVSSYSHESRCGQQQCHLPFPLFLALAAINKILDCLIQSELSETESLAETANLLVAT